jgi:RHS repeat-associated protein
VSYTISYNAANQISSAGFSYDANGNLIDDGPNAYTWDRANRLLSMGGISYRYDGMGNRTQQSLGVDVTRYPLDMQPGLVAVLGDSTGNRYIHAPRGIHAVDSGTGWTWPVQDALGSVRGHVGDHNRVLSNVNYSEYGVPSAPITGFAFTGEMRDGNGLQYHRARYLSPALGGWLSQDTLELGNLYQYALGNPVNRVDSTGLFAWTDFVAGQGYLVEEGDTLACIARELGAVDYSTQIQPFINATVSLNSGRPVLYSENRLVAYQRLLLPDDVPNAGMWNINGTMWQLAVQNPQCPANAARHVPSAPIVSSPSLGPKSPSTGLHGQLVPFDDCTNAAMIQFPPYDPFFEYDQTMCDMLAAANFGSVPQCINECLPFPCVP